ncbi:MAG: TAXI family TRAP transporter solute-binding subunit [Pseudomonadota bacterium]
MKVYWPFLLIALIGVIVSFRFVEPPPPRSVTFAAGSPGGAFYAFAERYKRLLEDEGVSVELLSTAGSVENIRLLREEQADIALIQGGITQGDDIDHFRTLGGLFKEPLWIFARADSEIQTFADLKTARAAIGPVGSGTRTLVLSFREQWGGGWTASSSGELGGSAAADALMNGDLDAAAFVASIDAPYIRRLLVSEGVRLLPFDRAAGLSRRTPSLAPVTLLSGVVDVGDSVPATDMPLIAAVAQLAVHRELHPAIQALLLEAAGAIHAEGSLLSEPGEFPDPKLVDAPLSGEAQRYYDRGPSALRRWFSFSVANFLERAWVIAIPLLTLAIPLLRVAPPVYRWRVRRKIYVWYDDLRDLEARGRNAKSRTERDLVQKQLDELQEEVGLVEVPLSYTDDLYRLRSHISFVNELVGGLAPRWSDGPETAPANDQLT